MKVMALFETHAYIEIEVEGEDLDDCIKKAREIADNSNDHPEFVKDEDYDCVRITFNDDGIENDCYLQ